MNNFQKFIGHLSTVLTHKWYVFKYCWKADIVWRGIKHDMSKFSPVEFFESVKYFQGHRSPIDAAKEDKGYSNAWMHHKGHNRHHYEWWVDDLDHGGKPLQMPFEDALELICDTLGAAKAYHKDKFTYNKVLEFWQKKHETGMKMHPQAYMFLTMMLEDMVKNNNCDVLIKEYALVKYRLAVYKCSKEKLC